LFGLLGGKSKQFFLWGVNKKKLQKEKPKMTYITGGKDLLTQINYIGTKCLKKLVSMFRKI